MTQFKLKIKGVNGLNKKLSRIDTSVQKLIDNEIKRASLNIESSAKQLCPVDTGTLRSSIRALHEPMKAQVYTDKKYAPYVEFGTGSGVSIPNGLESYAAEFKGEGKREVNLPARAFLFPAWDGERPKLIKRIRKILSSIK